MNENKKYTYTGIPKTKFKGIPSLRTSFKKAAKHPKHKKDSTQAKAGTGIGVTGVPGCAGAETFQLLGENIIEVIGSGTAIGLIGFFLVKFFTIELEELSEELTAEKN
tara:strand:+ start:1069 stop:1392 length:324 start_codon:yes stop_codon:yes gene_type:complete